MTSVNTDSFSFPVCVSLIFLSYCIGWDSSTVSGRGVLFLVLILEKESVRFLTIKLI